MRIISQDGMVNLPYENIGISINLHNKTDIIAYPICNCGSDSGFWIMALYSTEAKAQKAMEILQNTYYEHESEKIYKEGANYTHPYFRFPKDEGVEV